MAHVRLVPPLQIAVGILWRGAGLPHGGAPRKVNFEAIWGPTAEIQTF